MDRGRVGAGARKRERMEGMERGGTLGELLAAPGAGAKEAAEMVDGALEDAVVLGSGNGDDRVLGGFGGLGLEELLQPALGIGDVGGDDERVEGVLEEAHDEAPGAVVAGIDEHGPDDGLEGVGDGGGALAAAAGFLAAAQDEVGAELECVSVLGEGGAIDELGTGLGQGALAEVGVVLVEPCGDDDLDDGVAKELEALVVQLARPLFMGDGGMGEGEAQEGGIAEAMAQRRLEVGHRWHGGARRAPDADRGRTSSPPG